MIRKNNNQTKVDFIVLSLYADKDVTEFERILLATFPCENRQMRLDLTVMLKVTEVSEE